MLPDCKYNVKVEKSMLCGRARPSERREVRENGQTIFWQELRSWRMSAILWRTPRDAVADYGAIMWRQLVLLGFNATEYARKEGVRDPDALGPRMFHSQSPNRGGLFCVLHFLFALFSDDFAKAIAPCFPTYDAEGKKEFRSVAQKLIQSLCDGKLLPKECGIRAGSVLNVPEGTRAYQLVLQIATVVTIRVLQRDHGSWYTPQATVTDETGCGEPSECVSKPDCVSVCRALQLRAFNDCERFQKRAVEIVATQQHWMATADALHREYIAVTTNPEILRKSADVPVTDEDIAKLLAPVEAGWRGLDSYTNSEDIVQATHSVATFVERQRQPLSYRVDVAPMKVALSAAGSSSTDAPLLPGLAAFGGAVTSLLKALEPSTTPCRWVQQSEAHLKDADASLKQAVHDIRTVSASMRENIAALRDSVHELKRSRIGPGSAQSTPGRLSRLPGATPAHEYAPSRSVTFSLSSPLRQPHFT